MTEGHAGAVDNEIASRARNEWIEATNESFGTAVGLDKYVCECSDGGCTSTMDLSRDEYEVVRQNGNRFAIAIDHEDPETERVVAEYARYAVVERLLGDPRRIANDTDPRRAPLASSSEPPEANSARSRGAERP